MPALLRARDLAWTPPGARQPLFARVDIDVRPGEMSALLGRSGTGKSVLLSCLAGLRAPSRGSVELSNGGRPSPDDVAVVFQNPDHQFVAARLDRELAFGLEVRGADPAAMRTAVERAAADIGLERRLGASPSQLSAGQRQRLALAAGTIAGPRFLLADEPTSHLDWGARRAVLADLRERARRGCGVLLVTQFPDEAALADSVWILAERGVRRIEPQDLQLIRGWPQTDLARLAACVAASGGSVPPRITDADLLAQRWSAPASSATRNVPRGRTLVSWDEARPIRYGGGCPVVEIGPLEIRAGERLVLAGASASGKTSVLRALAGDLPGGLRGQVRDGVRVGFVLQSPERMFYRTTAWDELGVAARDADAESRAVSLVARLGLDAAELRRRSAFHLSVGEQRRLAIAGQILRAPDLLLLDEPTAGLDPPTASAVCEALATAVSADTAVVIATHDLGTTAALGDRYLLLGAGEVRACATQRELLHAVVTKSQEVDSEEAAGKGEALPVAGFFPAWWQVVEAIRGRGFSNKALPENELNTLRGLEAPLGGRGSLC